MMLPRRTYSQRLLAAFASELLSMPHGVAGHSARRTFASGAVTIAPTDCDRPCAKTGHGSQENQPHVHSVPISTASGRVLPCRPRSSRRPSGRDLRVGSCRSRLAGHGLSPCRGGCSKRLAARDAQRRQLRGLSRGEGRRPDRAYRRPRSRSRVTGITSWSGWR